MNNTQEQNHLELTPVEEQEKYLLHSQAAVRQVLDELAKKPEMISAYFNNGSDAFLTVILAVLRERNMVVFDYGQDIAQNRRLLEAGRMTCVTRHNDILVRFTVTGVQGARFKGEPVFAAPIPETLLRLQRREYFRVNTPVINPVICRLPLEQGKSIELPLTDISAGGVGMIDPSLGFEAEAGDTFRQCRLLFPDDEGSLDIDLKIRNIYGAGADRANPLLRIGASFVALPMDKHAFIQRYIHRLQIQQSTLRRD